MTLLTEELKAFIGREAHYPAREELGRASIRYFALAVDDDNPLYLDDAYAKQAGYPSLIAPPNDLLLPVVLPTETRVPRSSVIEPL